MRKENFVDYKKLLKSIFFLSMIILISCSSGNKDNAPAESGTPVKIVNPFRANLTEYIHLNANTLFLNKEIVRSTFQGFIEKIYKNIGDQVSIGDPLFLIRTKESAAMDTLKINIGDKLFEGNITIKAQANGILTYLNFNSGDFVSEGEQLAIISNPSSLRINLNVPYQYVLKISTSTVCTVLLPDGKTVKARIQKVMPSVDESSQTQTYILKLDMEENLPENLNVSVQIPISYAKDALTVPKSAVMSNETLDKFWVMKLINDNTAVRVDIQKGIVNDSLVQVIKPTLDLNEKIISEGAYGLPDTANVVVTK